MSMPALVMLHSLWTDARLWAHQAESFGSVHGPTRVGADTDRRRDLVGSDQGRRGLRDTSIL
jgi:hypothetical protein